VVQARHDINFNAQIDRVQCRPWGLFGGLSGAGNAVAIHRFGQEEQRFANGKAFNFVLHPGDAYILRSGGGGGFESPLDRDVAAVENDIRQGYVSKDAAERYYGAVFVPGTLEIDRAATAARRQEMRAQGLPQDDADQGAGTIGSASVHAHGHEHHHAAYHDLSEEERLVLAMSGRCCS
jgi:N-methylhydantoinase B